jgi:hypothetical protein
LYVTYHLVEGDDERREIFSRLSPGETWDVREVDAMGLAQADEEPLAFAIAATTGPYLSRLVHAAFPARSADDEVSLHLLDYLFWELKEKGRRFLLIDRISSIDALARVARLVGLDPDLPLLIRLDDQGFLDLLKASA